MADVARAAGALGGDELLGPGVVEGAGLHGGAVALQLLKGGGWWQWGGCWSKWLRFLWWRRDFLALLFLLLLLLLLPVGCCRLLLLQ